MRSSIACARCRRSKVKCVNNGVNTTCRDCEAKGRECTYPTPATGGHHPGVPRRESSITRVINESGTTGDRQTPRRQKPKRIAATSNVSTKESMRALVDALDPAVLTPRVWIELHEIFQTHFSADLPFLHPPTFLKPLRQMPSAGAVPQDFGTPQGRNGSSAMPPGPPLLLLAFLALTARFHPQLVAHHSPPSASRASNPLIASEYYAAACRARLAGNSGDGLGHPDITRIQALLMLATHEWSHCQGTKAFISLGVAVRYAQLMGLQYQDDLDDEPESRSTALLVDATRLGVNPEKAERFSSDDSEDFIKQEVRRRTFWACFVLDRLLSSGKHRPQMLHVDDLRLQLPASDRAFLFGDRVRTLMLSQDEVELEVARSVRSQRGLHEYTNGTSHRLESIINSREASDPKSARWEVGPDEGLLSRYVKALNLFGKVIKWSCAGGRRRERFPPWDARSMWFELQRHLSTFIDRLPRDMALTSANISAHISSRTSTPYTLLHTTLLLCNIILHRDYIPFLPLRCNRPQGPLDPPMFPPEEAPPQFWEASARELFQSARELIDLVSTCNEWNVLVHTPLVGFAVYTAAFTGTYSNHFPWMDQEGYLCKRPVGDPQARQGDSRGFEAARRAVEILGDFRRVNKMADGWLKTINQIHRYFKRIKKDFNRNTTSPTGDPLPQDPRNLTLREGGFGGGLEEYKLFEKTLRDFGSLEDEDTEMADVPEIESGRAPSSTASVSAVVKGEGLRIHEGTPESAAIRQDRWNAINNAAAPGQPIEPTTNGASSYFPTHPSMPSGQTTPSIQQAQYATASTGTSSPLISPATTYGHSGSGFPPNPFHQKQPLPQNQQNPNQLPPISQMHQPPLPQHNQQQPSAWTPEQRDNWLKSLDTAFSGDDVAAFVEGRAPGVRGFGGWLSAVWAGASPVSMTAGA